MAHVFIMLSYLHLIRVALYYGVLIHHRVTLGWLESRYRKDINAARQIAGDKEVQIKFNMVKFQGEVVDGDQELSSISENQALERVANNTCSICCVDYLTG
jgi:hypothetical protein